MAQERDGYESDQWKLHLHDRANKLYVVDFDGDDAGTIVWRRDSQGLLVSVVQKAKIWIEAVALDGTHKRYAQAPGSGDFDVAPDGTVVAVLAGITHPPEVFTLPTRAPVRLSHFNDEQYEELNLGSVEYFWIDGHDSTKVHSYVVRPAGNPKAPLLVLIHGGPQGSWEDSWSMRWNIAAFAARGYIVLVTDFHGSIGYGQKFKEEISGDWGGLAYEDIQRATDAALQLPNVTGIGCAAGTSYGGP